MFLIGSWLRYDYGQYTWRAASSQMLDRKGMNLASNLFHIGILGIFAGHFLGMLTPHWMYESFLPIDVKQKMAMIAGGALRRDDPGGAGYCCSSVVCSARAFAPPTTGADILILSLLMVQCALGLLTIPFSAQHMDGSEMMKLVGWAQSVVTFHGGASQHLDGVAFIFPRSPGAGYDPVPAVPVLPSGSHIWSAPVEYLTRKYQIVRARR
ncbi:respiratory nitrate reductase subunit gamma [Klebsiella pneumoniae subsp. pneumoniae]|nr:respiratory nitrate reductase subunit gamma [Klebsiella pneumoniae subsp. pneumoniae]